MDETKYMLLVCTVGGSPEPIVAALKQWRPVRVHFVHTPKTKQAIDADILRRAAVEGVGLDAGRYDCLELRDEQDLAACIDTLRQLTPVVEEWVGRGGQHQVVVDFTGGTKCMSAALALQARRWPCLFSYVGGSERTKEGVGVVVSGKEQVLHHQNPWDALGYQAVEDFVGLFDQCAFVAAASVAEEAKKRVSIPERRRELNVLEQLARAFDAWDRFDHKSADNTFTKNVEPSGNDLRAVLGQHKGDRVLADVKRLTTHLAGLCAAAPPSRHHVVDLLANARRRHDEGRIDDAVARLYRAIEALAQVGLKERHQFESTEKIPLDRVPSSLWPVWERRADGGTLSLGLQDAYALLDALGDDLGAKFRLAGLHDPKGSPLTARNRSILAHGFERVSDKVFDRLWSAAIELAAANEGDLPSFPKLSEV